MSKQSRFNKMHKDIQQKIDQYGFTVMGVFPTEDEPGVEFAYTIGLSPKYGFELIMTGVPMQDAQALFHYAHDAYLQPDGKLPMDRPVEGGASMPMMYKQADPERAAFLGVQALQHYHKEEGELPFVQVVWPDPNAKFPGDPGYAWGYANKAQHLLYTPPKPEKVYAVVIDPAKRTVEKVAFDNDRLYEQAKKLIKPVMGNMGYMTLSREILCWNDDDALLTPWDRQAFFRAPFYPHPVVGVWVITSLYQSPDGEDEFYIDCILDADKLRGDVEWVDAHDVRIPAPTFHSIDPKTGEPNPPEVLGGGPEEWTFDDNPGKEK